MNTPAHRLKTPLTETLGIDHPIILAPMASTSGGRLAAAVSNAGGLGLLGGGYGDPDWLKKERAIAGDADVGVGFITWSIEDTPETLDIALGQNPKALMLSFGDFTDFARRVTDSGTPLIIQVQTVEEARRAADAGAAVIVAQGQDAGGHGTTLRGTAALVPAIADAVGNIPVAAAGGICDGRGLAGALALGASGILMGTRFYASTEALTDDETRKALVEGKGDDTIATGVFDMIRGPLWPQPYGGRALRNAMTERWHGREDELAEIVEAEKARYRKAVEEKDNSYRVVWAGEGVDMINEILDAETIVHSIVRDAVSEIDRLKTLTA